MKTPTLPIASTRWVLISEIALTAFILMFAACGSPDHRIQDAQPERLDAGQPGLSRGRSSCVQGGYAGEGNLADNPSFIDPDNPAGPDGIFWTADDGFLPRPVSTCAGRGARR